MGISASMTPLSLPRRVRAAAAEAVRSGRRAFLQLDSDDAGSASPPPVEPEQVALEHLQQAYDELRHSRPYAGQAQLFGLLRLLINRLEAGGVREPVPQAPEPEPVPALAGRGSQGRAAVVQRARAEVARLLGAPAVRSLAGRARLAR